MNLTSTWAIVLAAGDGTRLAPLTRQPDGTVVPKQYFDFGGGRTLLAGAVARARRLVAAEQVLAVVSESHRRWWEAGVPGLLPSSLVVQPENRGTAPGLLLPLLHLYYRDPDAVVVVLPSDHHVGRENVLWRALASAVTVARREPLRVVLLGMKPDAPQSDYGWILANPGPADGPRGVAAFVEKPDRERATRLMEHGALWSSFMMVGHVSAFLKLFAQQAPELLRLMLTRLASGGGTRPSEALAAMYRSIPVSDFSRDVLEGGRESLSVMSVPECGWSDLGTPERVLAVHPRGRSHAAPLGSHTG